MSEGKKLLFGACISVVLMIVLHAKEGYDPGRLEREYLASKRQASLECMRQVFAQQPLKRLSVDEYEKLVPCCDVMTAERVHSYFRLVAEYSPNLSVEDDELILHLDKKK